MNGKNGGRSPMKSAGALFAGLVVGVVLSLGTDEALHLLSVYPPWGQSMSDGLFILATAYRIVYSVIGSYVVAWLAPNRPMWHSMVLGYTGVVVSGIGAAATWNHQPSLGPHWYPIVLVALALPCSWLGGWLRERQLHTLATQQLVVQHKRETAALTGSSGRRLQSSNSLPDAY